MMTVTCNYCPWKIESPDVMEALKASDEHLASAHDIDPEEVDA